MSMGAKTPKTPESEKIKAQVSAQLFKEGSSIKSRVGDKYVQDVTRKTQGREAAGENLENEKRKSEKPRGRKATQVAAAALSGTGSGIAGAIDSGMKQGQRRGSAANFATSTANNMVHTMGIASDIDNGKAMNKFVKRNEITQMGLDGASAVAGTALMNKWDKDKADKQKREDDLFAEMQESEDKRKAGIGGW